MITHLYDFFGKISPHDLEDNAEKIMTPDDPFLPITTLFTQVENCVAYSEAGNIPFTPTQIIRKVYLLILETGSYAEDYHKWIQHPPLQHIWVNFKADFPLAYQFLREM